VPAGSGAPPSVGRTAEDVGVAPSTGPPSTGFAKQRIRCPAVPVPATLMIFGVAPGAGKTILLIASLAGAGVDPPSTFTSAPIAAASVAMAPITATTMATRDHVRT
jgi:hypothetical protein